MKNILIFLIVAIASCGDITINQIPTQEKAPEVAFLEECNIVTCIGADFEVEEVSYPEYYRRCEWNCASYEGANRYVSIIWQRLEEDCYFITSEWDTNPKEDYCSQ